VEWHLGVVVVVVGVLLVEVVEVDWMASSGLNSYLGSNFEGG